MARSDGLLHPVRPSAPVKALYVKRLEDAVTALHRSIAYWLKAQWARDTPATVANDASPVVELRRLLRKRGRLWRGKFRALAAKLAEEFAGKSQAHVDRALSGMLRDNGMSIKFRLSRTMTQTLQATVDAQVALITGLADDHLKRVEGYVMRSVQAGRDLKQLTDDLEDGLGIARRRAAFIARHQSNIATATMARTRGLELGCEEGEWLHSAGGKTPRPEHVAFSGKRYKLAKGAYLEGKWTHPGVEPNCRCVSRLVLPSAVEMAA